MSVEMELEAFILEEIALGRGIASIGRDEDVLARGIIDSLGVTQLVAFIEERYGIRVTDDDLVPANFQSLGRIEDFISRKLQAAGALP
jgi:acyl carrier protein